ncbi:hypothetical protein BC830DRAFT_1146042 [Chytriomyces sp. MP71]|nr:hypothetical protein BC830DRAFT_1146042 [Chytriomyces sp. MP71]
MRPIFERSKSDMTVIGDEDRTLLEGIAIDDDAKAPVLAKHAPEGSLKEATFAVSFYIVTSIVMVLVNKAVLNAVDLPLIFLWLQLVVAVLLLLAFSATGMVTFQTLSPTKRTAIMPLIVVNVVGLTLNTYCLKYVDASFYQVARALVLPITVLFSRLFLKQTVSNGILISCAVVFTGFLVGTLLEGKEIVISVIGLSLGIASSVSTAAHSIVIKSSYAAMNGNTLDMVYYNNLLSMFMLTPVVMVSGELQTVMDIARRADAQSQFHALAVGGLVTGVFGFLINIAGFFQIKVTSPITHMISSAFRGVLQTLLAVAVFGDVLTSARVTSIGIILFGSALYAWVSSKRAAAEKK